MRSYYTYGAIPDPVRTVRGFDDGGLAMIEPVGLAGAGGEDKPLMQQLYERGEISDAEYRAWLEGQAAEQSPLSTYPRPPDESTGPSGLEVSPYKPPDESTGPSQEYNPVTTLPTTIPVQGALEASPYKPPVETAGPSQEYNPVTALPTTIAAPAPVAAPAAPTGLTMKDIFVGGVPAGIDPNAPFAPSTQAAQQLTEADRLARERVLEPGALSSFVGPTGTGTPVMQGNFSMLRPERSAAEVAADFAKASGLDLAGFAASQGKTEQQLMADINAAETDPNTRRGALNIIQDRVSAGDFQGAFEAAKAAEARLGGDFVSNLVSPSTLRYLAPAMSPTDINNYYDALKNVVGEQEYEKRYVSTGNEFSIEQARANNLAAAAQGQNFVNPDAGVKAETSIVGKIGSLAEPLAKAALIAGTIYGGAQFLGGLGGAGGAGGAGAGAGAAGAGAAGATQAATALSAIEAAGVLPEVVVAATKVGMTIPQFLATLAGTSAAASTLGGAGATGQPLQEVVSQASRLPPSTINPYAYPLLASTSVGLPQTGMSDIVPQPEGATPSDLEEVTVQAQRPIDWSWLSGALASAPGLAQIASQIGAPNIPSLGPPEVVPDQLEEITIPGQRPIDWSWLNPALAAAPTLAQIASQIGAPNIPELNLEQLNPEDILKDYKPTEIPTSSTLQDLIKKYGTLENVLKVLGMLGGAGAVSGGAGGTGLGGKVDVSGGAGFSSGLTPFDYGRRQLSPDIDYYTYATRPEAKFFEYGTQLAQPVQPPLTPPPSEPSGVITEAAGGYIDENMTGGLIGYAKGGKPERYVDGPGSGREDLIPAMLSDGEYVIDAETLALLGDGSTKEGARRMDRFRAKIRQHKGRALSRGRISPNAKSPEEYMGGGLT